jgi:hypothetical protein
VLGGIKKSISNTGKWFELITTPLLLLLVVVVLGLRLWQPNNKECCILMWKQDQEVDQEIDGKMKWGRMEE